MTKLHAQWIVGFVDGEGCFHVAVNTHHGMKFGKQILPEFTVVQHRRDIDILYSLKTYWKCGVVRVNHGDRFCYRVRKLHDLVTHILPFFERHGLQTKKHVDFLKFRDIVYALAQNKHKTPEGFQELCARIATFRKYSRSCKMNPEDKVQPVIRYDLDVSEKVTDMKITGYPERNSLSGKQKNLPGGFVKSLKSLAHNGEA